MQESDFAGVTQSLETGTRVGRILRLIRVVRVVKVISLLGKRNKDKLIVQGMQRSQPKLDSEIKNVTRVTEELQKKNCHAACAGIQEFKYLSIIHAFKTSEELEECWNLRQSPQYRGQRLGD